MDNELYINVIKSILDNIDEGIHFIDSQCNTIIYNKSMSNLEGMNQDEILNKSFAEISKTMKIKNSTLLDVLKNRTSIENNIQKYLNSSGKEIVTINTTIPVVVKDKLVGALEISKDITQVKYLMDQIEKLEEVKKISSHNPSKVGYNFDDIIGESNAIHRAISLSKKAAKGDATVFIYGETGTGKELISQSIHYASKRADKPFIAQNCAALPESLLEGILFGTSKGGFTGAVDRPGLFEQANKGTILLDEINSMPLQLQAKLLRVLQEGYVRRIGGTKEIPVDVRVIATTNEDPTDILKQGKLRKDLFYRLNVINIEIPPLRERGNDIILLSEKFIMKYNKKLEKNVKGLSEDCKKILKIHYWQGNVRELENTIYSSMSMMDDKEIIHKEDINLNLYVYENQSNNEMICTGIDNKPLDWIIADIEEGYINDALDRSNNNITKAAAILGIGRQNLQYKMRKYNIKREEKYVY